MESVVEILTNNQGLGNPEECRAFIIHRLPRLSDGYSTLSRWANTTIALYHSSLYPDSPEWVGPEHGGRSLAYRMTQMSYDPKKDYVVLSGDLLRIATVCYTLGGCHHDSVCFLRFDRDLGGYWPFKIKF